MRCPHQRHTWWIALRVPRANGSDTAEHGRSEPDIADRAGEQPNRVKRAGEQLDPIAREGAERRLVGDHAAIRPGPVDRARRLRPGRDRHRGGGDGRRRSARGAAGRPRMVERVEGVGGEHPCELRQLRLAGDHRPGLPEQAYGAGVAGGAMAGVDRRPVRRRVIDGVEVVLDGDGHPEQRQRRALGLAEAVERGRATEQAALVDRRPGPELVGAHRGEERLGHRDAGDLARPRRSRSATASGAGCSEAIVGG